MRQLDEIAQRNAQMVERAVTQAVNLEHRASTLAEAVAAFRLQQVDDVFIGCGVCKNLVAS